MGGSRRLSSTDEGVVRRSARSIEFPTKEVSHDILDHDRTRNRGTYWSNHSCLSVEVSQRIPLCHHQSAPQGGMRLLVADSWIEQGVQQISSEIR